MAPSAVSEALPANGVSQKKSVTMPLTNGHPISYAAKHNLAPHFIGGNHLRVAAPGRVKDFVAATDGHSVITSVSWKHQSISLR